MTSIPSRTTSTATSLLRRPLRPAALAALLMSLSPLADATSAPTFNIESYVHDVSADRATISHVIVYDYSELLGDLEQVGEAPIVSVVFGIEDGATIMAQSGPQELRPDDHYLPLDGVISFSRPGVFMGSAQIDLIMGDQRLAQRESFWVLYSGQDAVLVTYDEFKTLRLAELMAKPIPPDPSANLEPGDVPGESTTVADVPADDHP